MPKRARGKRSKGRDWRDWGLLGKPQVSSRVSHERCIVSLSITRVMGLEWFRSDEHDACHDLTWKRMSSISGNMWSMYQYVCSIYIWTVWDLFVKELLMILHDHVSYLLIKFSSYSKWNRLNNIWKQLKTYNNYQTAIQQTQRNHQALGCSTGSRWTGLGGAKQTYFFVEGVLSFLNGVFCWGQTYSSIERKCVFSLSLFLLFICSTFTCLGCTLAYVKFAVVLFDEVRVVYILCASMLVFATKPTIWRRPVTLSWGHGGREDFRGTSSETGGSSAANVKWMVQLHSCLVEHDKLVHRIEMGWKLLKDPGTERWRERVSLSLECVLTCFELTYFRNITKMMQSFWWDELWVEKGVLLHFLPRCPRRLPDAMRRDQMRWWSVLKRSNNAAKCWSAAKS